MTCCGGENLPKIASSMFADRVAAMAEQQRPLWEFNEVMESSIKSNSEDMCDFTFGNPQIFPYETQFPFSEATNSWNVPKAKDWYGYKFNVPEAQKSMAAFLSQHLGLPFYPQHVNMTNGAFGGMDALFAATLNPGDEVIFLQPYFFMYTWIVMHYGGKPVPVPLKEGSWDLDIQALKDSITPSTKMFLFNSPHNPTGRVFTTAELQAIAGVLQEASEQHGREILVLSDDAYRRLVYPGVSCDSIAKYYPATAVVYTFSKDVLIPGMRIGCVAVSSKFPKGEEFIKVVMMLQCTGGYLFPNSVLQYAVKDLQGMCLDMEAMQGRRDLLIAGLRGIGYGVPSVPEGTWYVFAKSPLDDDQEFVKMLIQQNVFVLPGTFCGKPGYVRIALTASGEIIQKAMPGFQKVLDACQAKAV